MKNQPFFALCLALSLGIIFSKFLDVNITLLWIGSGISFIGLIISYFRKPFLFSVFSFSFFLFFGAVHSLKFNEFEKIELSDSKEFHQLKIEKRLKPSANYDKYQAKLLGQKNSILLYLKSKEKTLYKDESVWVHAKLSEVPSPKNPHQFDYKKYLANNRIYYQCFADSVLLKSTNEKSVSYHFSLFKDSIKQKLKTSGYGSQTIQIISSMLLGDRTDLSGELQEDFSKAGVIHLLAISGLHVGMIFGIVLFVMRPLLYLRNGKIMRLFIGILFIWLFAFFVDFSPSVSRAALMLTLYYGSEILKRPANTYHSLSLSAFILLMFNPNFLFDVGFQLSYSAVFFIVWLMPVYQKYFKFKNRFSKYVSDLIGVSLSAQLGTAYFSVYYFHQFSFLFLFGNLILIPMSVLILAGGIVSVLLAAFNLDFFVWTFLYDKFIFLNLEYVHQLAKLNFLVSDNISLSFAGVGLLFLILLFLKKSFLKTNFISLFVFVLFILIFQAERIFNLYSKNKTEELIVFHQYKNSIIGVRKGGTLDVFCAEIESLENIKNYLIKPFAINEKIKKIDFHDLSKEINSHYAKTKNIIFWKDKKILITSKLDNSLLDFDYIILTNSYNLDLSQKEIPLGKLIVDGSSYRISCENCEEKIWNTAKKGYKKIIP